MKTRAFIILIFLFSALILKSQIFSNPSFEGPAPIPNDPPPGWEKCSGSPDTQPGVWDVPTPPSDGNSYLGICWLPSWIERVWTELDNPLKQDSCYLIQVDLAYYHVINYYGIIQETFPMRMNFHASASFCHEGPLLWQSPLISHPEWQTYEFVIDPEADISSIMIRSDYDSPNMPAEIGYILIDNIRVITPPDIDLGPDTTICFGDTITLNAGSGYGTYLWQDGSTDSTCNAYLPGIYYVIATTDYGCSVVDSIQITQSPVVDLGPDTSFCAGDTLILTPGSGFADYLWPNGSHDSLFYLWQPGFHEVWVQVLDSAGCFNADTILVEIINDSTSVFLGNDTTLCYGSEMVLAPGEFESYLWQDGSEDSSYVVSIPDLYWVMVEGNCGFASDSIEVDFYPQIDLNLGPDTAVCEGATIQLDAGPGFTNYIWNTGATGQTLDIGNEGTYWVTVTDTQGCSTADTIFVEFYQGIEVELGQDTTICFEESIVLDAGFGFVMYEWQDGQSGQFYSVSETGNYSVYVEDFFGCSGFDEIYVFVSKPVIDLGPDTLICGDQSLVLEAGEGFVSYSWQDNSANSDFEVMDAGTYWVTVTDEFGCEAFDEIEIGKFSIPTVDLGPDKGFCAGDTLILSAPSGNYNYYWNGEPATHEFVVTQPGTYSLSLVNPCDSVTDEIYITEYPVPEIDLGPDDVLFPGITITLEPGEGFDTYVWQDGSGQSYFVVSEENYNPEDPIYYVEVWEGQCKGSDSIMIDFFYVWVPEVITPNGDGKNDFFEPDMERWKGINSHHIQVLNRWGERVWETDNFPAGWDGKRNGKYVADGTYFWILEIFFGPENLKKILKGSLTVLGTSQ